jgi:NADH-quinone oxidoreductase subunit F
LTGTVDLLKSLETDKDLARSFDQLVACYPEKRAALIPCLHVIQDKLGWLPDDAVRFVARYFETSPADVNSVITFYDMFYREPKGKHEIAVCRNLACKLRGADAVVKALEEKLGCKDGEDAADGCARLRTFECLGGCTEAPLVAVDWEYYRNVDAARAEKIVDDLRAGKRPVQELRPEEPALPASAKGEVYLTKRMREIGHTRAISCEEYVKTGGYTALAKALSSERDAVIDEMKKSGLRGRGGAGFSAGMKWSFMPKESKKPHYLAVNADESEPGTCKDRLLMERDPHSLIEGAAIAAYAIRAEKIYVYIRGEYKHAANVLQNAIEEARKAGWLGNDVGGKGVKLDMFVTRGAGAYICGEETAMMESLEGKRGHPRPKPPFPAQSGLWKSPTTVNNVETLCNVPYIVNQGADWFRTMGNAASPGNLLYAVSGNVRRPGIFELPLGTSLKYLIEECAGGMLPGYNIVGINPGGASAGFLPPSKIDIKLDHDTLKAEQSMLGTGGVMVVDDKFGMIPAIESLVHFFEHETCGQCAPCREGCAWASKIVHRFHSGTAKVEDLDTLIDLLDSAQGRTICVYPEALAGPVRLGIKHFRAEFERAALQSNPSSAPSLAGHGH